jgi:hypothetical protein
MATERTVKLIAKLQDGISNPLRTMARGAVGFASAVAGVTTAVIIAARKLADYGSAIYDVSTALNISVESAQALGYVADQTGSSLQGLSGSIRALNTFLDQANTAGTDQNRIMQEMGFTYEQLRALSPEELFLSITDKLGGITDELDQNVAASTIFGNRFGTQVVAALNQTDGSLRTLMDDFAESGRAMSTEQIQALEKYGDAMTDLDYAMKSLLADALVPMLPVLQDGHAEMMAMAEETLPKLIPLVEDAVNIMIDTLPIIIDLLSKTADGWAKITDVISTGIVGGGQAQELMDSLTRAVETGAITVEEATAEWERYTAVTDSWGSRLGQSLISPIHAMAAAGRTLNQVMHRNLIEIDDDFNGVALASFNAASAVAAAGQVAASSSGGWSMLVSQVGAAAGLFQTVTGLVAEIAGTTAGTEEEPIVGLGSPEKRARAKEEIMDAIKSIAEEAIRLEAERYDAAKDRAVDYSERQRELMAEEDGLRKAQQADMMAAEAQRLDMIRQGTANLFTGIAMAATQGEDALAAWFDSFKARLLELTISSAFQALLGVLSPGGFLGGIFGGLFGRAGGGVVPGSVPGAAGGMIVPGRSTTQGDKVPMLLEPGELVLTRNQRANMERGMGGSVSIRVDYRPILSTASRAEIGKLGQEVWEALRKAGKV